MTSEQDRPGLDANLRRRAEQFEQRSAAQSPEDIESLSAEEIRLRFHELRVHQIELEMQNVQMRQAQLALETSQARYFDLYDMAPAGYCTVSEQGLLQEANLKAANLLGMARAELVGRRFSRFIVAEDSDGYYLLRKQLFESSEPQSCELRMVRADGTTFWVQVTATLAQDESGRPVSWMVLSDITERKQAETVLHRKQAMLARTEKIAQIGSWEWDVAADTVTWSDELFRLFQLEPTERAPSFAEQSTLYHPEDMAQLRAAVAAAVTKGTPYEMELRALRKDGTPWVGLARGQMEEAQGSNAKRLVGLLQDITGRKQILEALQESEERFRRIFNDSKQPFLLVENDHFIDANQATLDMMGYDSLAELRGTAPEAISPQFQPDGKLSADKVQEVHKKAFAQGSHRFEWEHVKKDGSHFFAEIMLTPIHFRDRSIIHVAWNDITERKQTDTYGALAKEILHLLNEPGDLRSAIERVLAAVKARTGFDAVGIRLQEGEDYPYFVQEGFSSDFLLKENSLIERTASGQICRDQDGNVRLECACGLVISGRIDPTSPLFTPGGSCWTNDATQLLDIPPNDSQLNPRDRCIHYDYASVALIPIRDKEQIIGLLQLNDRRKEGFTLRIVELLEGIAAYIGEALMRKKAEVALTMSEARYAETLMVVKTGLWDWHVPSGQAIFSKTYYAILGYEDGEFPTTYATWRALVHPDDVAEVEQELHQRVESGEGFEIELRMQMKSCRWRWVSICGKAIEHDLDNKAVRIIGTLSDIAERKQSEQETKALQAQLLQAQKMEAIGTLAGGIAHDFNNILGAIIGYAELASDSIPRESIAFDHLEKVQTAGHRAATLVKQILAFSRQANIERIPLKPAYAVQEAIKLLRPSLPSTITIKQQIDAANRSILADPTQLHQILMNLCTNAFHAMEQTGGVLEIILKDCELSADDLQHQPEVQPGKFVMLAIGDTGSGIGPDIQDKIFAPYFSTKGVGKGTGMGLAIAHGIITSYCGFILCDSAVGKGSLFRVYFPALDEESVSELKPALRAASPGVERILFIDDEKMLVELGKTMLETLGYEVTALASSQEALAIFQNQPDLFDAIITDQTMPGLTGIDLAKQILKIRPDMPIILCTGYSSLVNEAQAKAEGITAFTEKPMTKTMIASLLRKVLDARKQVG